MPTLTTYITNDGVTVRGTTARGVVRALRDRQWNAPDHKRDWMEQVAERIAHVANTAQVPMFANAEEFIAMLIRVGLLRLAD